MSKLERAANRARERAMRKAIDSAERMFDAMPSAERRALIDAVTDDEIAAARRHTTFGAASDVDELKRRIALTKYIMDGVTEARAEKFRG